MKNITLSTVICRCPVGRIQDNLGNMEKWIRAAKALGSGMVCFPELNIPGYSTQPTILENALSPDPEILHRLHGLASAYGVTVLAGLVEKGETGRLYASHVAMGPDGLIGVYRKLHIAPPEQTIFTPGADIPVFEAQGIRFGIQLCYDAHFPELYTRMALKGAEVILIPHASPRGTPKEKLASWMRHLTARAYDNSVYVVAWNQVGDNEKGLTFPGLAVVLGPSGRVEKQTLSQEETMMTLTLSGEELAKIRENRMHFFLPHRRADLFP
ncbi:MAG: nitrilase [Proteobacteria bacterium]|nr:nitrilase [Pseudomonadota bacterium]